MEKPHPKTQTYYEWSEIEQYLRRKYPQVKTRELWDWMCGGGDVTNDGYYTFPGDLIEDPNGLYRLTEEARPAAEVLMMEFSPDGSDFDVHTYW